MLGDEPTDVRGMSGKEDEGKKPLQTDVCLREALISNWWLCGLSQCTHIVLRISTVSLELLKPIPQGTKPWYRGGARPHFLKCSYGKLRKTVLAAVKLP